MGDPQDYGVIRIAPRRLFLWFPALVLAIVLASLGRDTELTEVRSGSSGSAAVVTTPEPTTTTAEPVTTTSTIPVPTTTSSVPRPTPSSTVPPTTTTKVSV